MLFCLGESEQFLSEIYCPHLPGFRGLGHPVWRKKPLVNGGGEEEGITNSEQLPRCYTLNRKQAKCLSKAAVVGVEAGGGCGHRSRTFSGGKSSTSPLPPIFLPLPSSFYQGSPSLIPAEVSFLVIKILIQINEAKFFENHPASEYL